MESDLKNEIDFEIRKNLTNFICASGANISHMKFLLKKKYVSKKDMLKADPNADTYQIDLLLGEEIC